MNTNNLEIERKFLITFPEIKALEEQEGSSKIEITQTYLKSGARLRKWIEGGKVSYIKTVKTHLTNLTRIEMENEISLEEYNELIKEADSELSKIRYRIPYKNQLLEIDVFPFWEKQAFLEIELKSEEDEIHIPDYVKVIREVTDDKAYRNYALSKKIPKEENF